MITNKPAEYYANMAPRFIADVNAGKLGKWLRILGYDTHFMNPADDDALLRLAEEEGRVLLTRDTGLVGRRAIRRGLVRALLLESDDWRLQLRQVLRELDLRAPAEVFSRCLRCNLPLEQTSNEAIADAVPPYVLATNQRFMMCPGCSRVYWRGTHWEHVRDQLTLLSLRE